MEKYKGNILLRFTLIIALFFILTGCNNSEPHKQYDAKKLIKKRCSSCHNLDMPPITSEDELAPPMMAVAFHVHSFVKPSDESQRTAKSIAFVKDYVYAPSAKKSFCDKKSLESYGIMPSQEKNVTKGELNAIAIYMFEHFTPQNLTKIQEEKRVYNSLEEGHKIALKYRCLGCHSFTRKVVGPSFKEIAKKVTLEEIKKSIQNGSRYKWKEVNKAIMPKFPNIKEREVDELSKWLLKQK